MTATIARTPNFMLRRLLAVLVLALIAVAVVAATVQASQTKMHVQVLRGGTQQVSGYDGGVSPVVSASGAVGQ